MASVSSLAKKGEGVVSEYELIVYAKNWKRNNNRLRSGECLYQIVNLCANNEFLSRSNVGAESEK